jgi:NAD(P)-dependent dehydrogenase (short-subunit alcohol dehydrogenase family)
MKKQGNKYIMIIFITGTSRGLGSYLFQYLKEQGHTVYGASRNPSQNSPHQISLDVSDEQACIHAVQSILQKEGKIDVLINNVGSHLFGAALETSTEELRHQMTQNFYGAVNMI